MSTQPISESQPNTVRRVPRRHRWGGFVMSPATAGAWASRHFGRDLDPFSNFDTVRSVILEKARPYRVNFNLIREEWPDGAQYMLVTQSARFNGYKGMDPSKIPQFEEGERGAIARQLLEQEVNATY